MPVPRTTSLSPRPRAAAAFLAAALATGCAARSPAPAVPAPPIVPHSAWEAHPPLGYPADATRRNLRPGDRLEFRDLVLEVIAATVDSTTAAAPPTEAATAADRAPASPPGDVVLLRLERGAAREERRAREGAAFAWQGYRIAVVAIHGPGELGAGLVALEVATLASLPPEVAGADSAGGAALRLRVPHEITHITLHHTGSREPLRPEDDPAEKLRGLQVWGARDRNWWDVPYHMLIDLDGRIYEGRDWHYMGETNTTYDPRGHFLISVIGNYGRQEPTPAQIEAIADLMAWAVDRFGVPLERIGGHYDYADTTCPGKHLRRYLEDGTLRRMVEERLARRGPAAPAQDSAAARRPTTGRTGS
ncbi:MAG TPA: peptidoglycan recognition family protein [Longimicrobiales bacterium]